MIVDLSKIPEGYAWGLRMEHMHGQKLFAFFIYEEPMRAKTYAYGATPQEAVDNAIKEFER